MCVCDLLAYNYRYTCWVGGWWGTSVYILIQKTFVESAPNLMPDISQGGCKAQHIRVVTTLICAKFGF